MDLWGPYKYMADHFVSHYVWILTMDSDALMEADPERARRAARQLPDAWTWKT